MIQLNPGNRLGHNLETLQHLKQHPFFNGIDFAAIASQQVTPPYLPPETNKSAELAKQRGHRVNYIEENRDNNLAPEIPEHRDLFREWF